jgi:hypothetical protein
MHATISYEKCLTCIYIYSGNNLHNYSHRTSEEKTGLASAHSRGTGSMCSPDPIRSHSRSPEHYVTARTN